MKIRVLAFATAGDAVGAHELEVSLAAGSRVAELKAELHHRYPGLEPLWPRLAIAVDGELVSEETPLYEGAEVALLPPVSGGSQRATPVEAARPDAKGAAVALVDWAIDLPGLVAAVSSSSSGAVVLFVGTVRDHHQGRAVTKITYTAYRSMAQQALRRIVSELEAAHSGLRLAIHHRLGEIDVGEASVVIAVSSPHRGPSYEASRQALERLKAEVPIWKKEHYADGGVAWREEESLMESARTGPLP